MLIRSVTMAKPQGYVYREYDDGRVQEFDIQQCCHCQFSWRLVRGSGRERGYCFRCQGVTCGAAGCRDCLHYERRVELVERGVLR